MDTTREALDAAETLARELERFLTPGPRMRYVACSQQSRTYATAAMNLHQDPKAARGCIMALALLRRLSSAIETGPLVALLAEGAEAVVGKDAWSNAEGLSIECDPKEYAPCGQRFLDAVNFRRTAQLDSSGRVQVGPDIHERIKAFRLVIARVEDLRNRKPHAAADMIPAAVALRQFTGLSEKKLRKLTKDGKVYSEKPSAQRLLVSVTDLAAALQSESAGSENVDDRREIARRKASVDRDRDR